MEDNTEVKKTLIHPSIKRANIVALFCFVLFLLSKGLDFYFHQFVLEAGLNNAQAQILTKLPEFELPFLLPHPQLQEGPFHSAKMEKNQERIVHFWAMWCAPCVAELPKIFSHAKTHPEQVFILINVSDDRAKAKKFLQKNSPQPPLKNVYQLYDEGMDTPKKFGTFKLPESYFFDKEGKLLRKIEGEGEWK